MKTPDKREHRHGTRRKDNVLLGFVLTSSLLFFVLSGPVRMGISYERYVLWMVAPGVLVLSRGAALFLERWPRNRKWCLPGGLLLLWFLLFGFYLHYFRFMKETGGQSEMAFRTGPIEPKQAAAEFIFARAVGKEPVYVVSSSWFSHWPMVYIAKSEPVAPNVRFVLGDAIQQPELARELDRALQAGRLIFAELGETSTVGELRRGMKAGGVSFGEQVFRDYGGKPAVILLNPAQRNTQR